MKGPYIPFFAFLVLLVLTIPFSFDFATSVVPGWHTTIFPPGLIWAFVLIFVILLVTIGYWLLLKRADKISWTLFVLHFIFTIPLVIFTRFPFVFLHTQHGTEEELMKAISLQIKLTPVARALFIVGQTCFIIYFVKTINSKRFSA